MNVDAFFLPLSGGLFKLLQRKVKLQVFEIIITLCFMSLILGHLLRGVKTINVSI